MEVRPAGRVTEVRARQRKKAPLPMKARWAGKPMQVREHLSKAKSPIRVRPVGRAMEVSEVQPPKALSPMEMRLRGQATETSAVNIAERLDPCPAGVSCRWAAPRARQR